MSGAKEGLTVVFEGLAPTDKLRWLRVSELFGSCLLYTSDAADERSSVDLGGRRIIKKKKSVTLQAGHGTNVK